MMSRFGLLIGLFVALSAFAVRAETLDGGRYGPVHVAIPTGDIRNYVVVFSDRGGWDMEDEHALAAIARDGAFGVGVDTDVYLANIAGSGKSCDQLVGDAEALSRQLQRVHPTTEYSFPILAGIGQGGLLAYATLAEAPVNTFSGAVSLDPTPTLPGTRPLCPGATATADGKGGYLYGAIHDLQGFWLVGFGAGTSADARARIEELRNLGTPVEVQKLPGEGNGEALAALVGQHLNRATTGDPAALPLVELPVGAASPLMAVVLSGDGGWRDLDKTIAEKLQAQGIPVVGWDSLRYFWRKKSPEQTADDLAAVLGTYSSKWSAGKIALIGYSFGADVLPQVYIRLPEALRKKIVLVSLLGLEAKADWEISVSGWLGAPPTEAATPIAPALALMPAGLIQCFYGEKESESACPSLPADRIELIRTPGSHHFGHDYAALARDIEAGFRRRAGD